MCVCGARGAILRGPGGSRLPRSQMPALGLPLALFLRYILSSHTSPLSALGARGAPSLERSKCECHVASVCAAHATWDRAHATWRSDPRPATRPRRAAARQTKISAPGTGCRAHGVGCGISCKFLDSLLITYIIMLLLRYDVCHRTYLRMSGSFSVERVCRDRVAVHRAFLLLVLSSMSGGSIVAHPKARKEAKAYVPKVARPEVYSSSI